MCCRSSSLVKNLTYIIAAITILYSLLDAFYLFYKAFKNDPLSSPTLFLIEMVIDIAAIVSGALALIGVWCTEAKFLWPLMLTKVVEYYYLIGKYLFFLVLVLEKPSIRQEVSKKLRLFKLSERDGLPVVFLSAFLITFFVATVITAVGLLVLWKCQKYLKRDDKPQPLPNRVRYYGNPETIF
ncbi:hypothetical protein QR680_004120 [Steinernema hermaphroditum]|uniref:Uncharacterized protein n=1 Tax=Steinernema hermaphroditum TaxID=289476 RepID=A0AA39HMP8_9BILA|nr:hypothetical protein QR680_004120 [Steinernema hermaphroditum]